MGMYDTWIERCMSPGTAKQLCLQMGHHSGPEWQAVKALRELHKYGGDDLRSKAVTAFKALPESTIVRILKSAGIDPDRG